VIEELQEKVDEGAIDKVLQNYLHEHPWLLDPSWERATGSSEFEEAVRRELLNVDEHFTPEERQGRIDVRYIKTTDQHVVIDLRDANRKFSRGTLVEQLSKYRTAIKRVLKEFGRGGEAIEIVSVIGQDLEEWEDKTDKEETSEMLEAINARLMKYEELLSGAAESYERYMTEREEAQRIQRILDSIEAEDVF
jgi:hypothetical protein